VQVQVENVVQVGAYRDLVLGIVGVERLAVAADHHLGDLLPFEDFPAIEDFYKFLGVKSSINIFLEKALLLAFSHLSLQVFVLVALPSCSFTSCCLID